MNARPSMATRVPPSGRARPPLPPPRDSLSLAALILANLLPLAGVALFAWDIGLVVLLYWLENLVIGGYNLLKMLLVRLDPPAQELRKLLYIPFFCFHYGVFCAVHGIILLSLFQLGGPAMPGEGGPPPLFLLDMMYGVLATIVRHQGQALFWPVLGLVVSHGVSFVQNFLRGGEIRTLSLEQLMAAPYGRVVVLHIAIILGAILIQTLGSQLPLLLGLVLLKTGLDLKLHRRSHRRPVAPTAPAARTT